MSHGSQNTEDANGTRPTSKGMTPERLTEMAQEYFARDFPNSSEHGCPPRGTLARMASARGIPDQALRAHIFGCSECFREYRAALPVRQPIAKSRWRFFTRFATLPAPAYGALAASIILTVTLLIWTRDDSNTPTVTNLTPPGAPMSAPDPADGRARGDELTINLEEQESRAEPQGSTRQLDAPRGQRRRRGQPGRQAHEVRIDLASYSVLRSAEVNGAATVRPAVLRAAKNRLLIALPERSPVGEYHVTIVDADGAPLAGGKAVSAKRNTLRVDLDLSTLAIRKGRLRVAREGESPDFFPVEIEPRKR